MEDNIFDDLEMIMSDRISIAYSKNEQYQKNCQRAYHKIQKVN